MKTKTKTIRRIVSEHDPAEYERAFNDMSEKLSRFSPKIKDVFEDGRFTSIFSYEVTEKIPENAKDRAELEGIRYLCKNCPHMVNDGDRRKKRRPCDAREFGTTFEDCDACNLFYEELLQGKIEVIEDE